MLPKIINPPAPTPWTERPDINISMLTAAPHIALPIKNTAIAPRTIGLRPQISLNFPHIGPTAAWASIYAEPTHVYPAEELNVLDMVGSGVVTIVASRAARNMDNYVRHMNKDFLVLKRAVGNSRIVLPL